MSNDRSCLISRAWRLILALATVVALLTNGLCPALSAVSEPYLVRDVAWGFQGSEISKPIAVGDTLFFCADDGIHGYELWKSDGTHEGTALVKDLSSGENDYCYIGEMVSASGMLFFSSGRAELWKSDGTDSGTVLVKAMYGYDIHGLTELGDMLYFGAEDFGDSLELWKSDGSESGTVLIKVISSDPSRESSQLTQLTDFGGALFFEADDSVHGHELWKSDGTEAGTVLVKDIVQGNGSSYPWQLSVTGNELFFSANDGVHGEELWKTDGTREGTVMVKDIAIGIGKSDPYDLTAMSGVVLFEANDGTYGEELWMSDGTHSGTVLVKDIQPGADGSYPSDLTEVAGTLFFEAHDGTWELWTSDGSEGGTEKVKYINRTGPAYLQNLTAAKGELLFTADDGIHGQELWRSNGTEVGTVMVKDIRAGVLGAEPEDLTVAGSLLFFRAHDGVHGEELWALDLGACSVPAKPVLVSPTDYATTCDATPELSWKAASRAKQYQIRIADGNTSEVVIQTEMEDTSFQPPAPLAPGAYFWRVRASNDCGWSAWSEKWWFTVLPPPAAPVLYSPEDGSRTYETRPIFAWSAAAGVEGYRLQADDEASFATPAIDQALPGASYRPPDPLPPGTYHWRVRAVYDCGNSAWTGAYRVTVLPVGLEYGAYLPLVRRGTP